MFTYPIILKSEEDGTLSVTIPDFPDVNVRGDDTDDACAEARWLLELEFDSCVKERKPIPLPSALTSEHNEGVFIPHTTALRILLWNEMCIKNFSFEDMYEKIPYVTMSQIRRFFDFHTMHTPNDSLCVAIAKQLGKKINISLVSI